MAYMECLGLACFVPHRTVPGVANYAAGTVSRLVFLRPSAQPKTHPKGCSQRVLVDIPNMEGFRV